MIQFYLLSVILNIVAGYSLVSYQAGPKGTKFDGIREFLQDKTVRLVVGVLTVAVGFFKLLSVMRGDIPIIGDFVPSAAGMVSGLALLLEFYKANSTVNSDALEKFNAFLESNRRIVGLSAMASGLMHFLFANFLFL